MLFHLNSTLHCHIPFRRSLIQGEKEKKSIHLVLYDTGKWQGTRRLTQTKIYHCFTIQKCINAYETTKEICYTSRLFYWVNNICCTHTMLGNFKRDIPKYSYFNQNSIARGPLWLIHWPLGEMVVILEVKFKNACCVSISWVHLEIALRWKTPKNFDDSSSLVRALLSAIR